MIQIDFPSYNFRIKKENNRHLIFDEIRHAWVALTPEEWVRQNFLQYLVKVKNYAAAVISVEKMIKVGELKKRYDIVVYKNDHPWLIVECKESHTVLNIPVVEQVLRYNMALSIKYFVLTNGNETHAYEISGTAFNELNELPDF
jgi:hypothetical protein